MHPFASSDCSCRRTFSNRAVLHLALVHRSAATPNNTSLAWLGDAVLQLIASEQLMGTLGYISAGRLSSLRQQVIKREHCAAYAEKLGLQSLIVVGNSLRNTKDPVSPSMLGETFEAVLGAVYVDGGLAAAKEAFAATFSIDEQLKSRSVDIE